MKSKPFRLLLTYLYQIDTCFDYRLQRIVDEMIVCFKEARRYERDIFSKYIAKCNVFYGGTLIFVYMTGVVFVIGPVALPIDYPLECEYPFRVNYTSIIILIYFHQSFVCFQCAAHVCLSAFGAFLLWFTAARFECLAMEFQFKYRRADRLHQETIALKEV